MSRRLTPEQLQIREAIKENKKMIRELTAKYKRLSNGYVQSNKKPRTRRSKSSTKSVPVSKDAGGLAGAGNPTVEV
jgi:hypothetical protein